jgi:branched-chain amino acid transport system ATP-binding protein
MSLLELSGISVRFGGVAALTDVSFQVAVGGATALIGPNGAGKTTCFNVISGFQRPAAGTVAFDGTDMTNAPPHRRAGIGRTFQRIALVAGMSVRENVMLGLHGRAVGSFLRAGLRTPSVRASERVIADATDALLDDYGLSEVADRPALTLPLGVQRLVEMARAQAQMPRLMLLDEPASGLDQAEIGMIAERIARLRAEGRGLLVVEHDLSFVTRVASHLVVLQYGRIIYDGPVAAGMDDEAVRSAYLGMARVVDA